MLGLAPFSYDAISGGGLEPAARYWVGGTGNTSDAAHWSEMSGGAGGASVPTSANSAVFDAASSTTAYTVTVDATFSCLDLNFSAAPSGSGTITFAGSAGMTVAGNRTLLASMTYTYTGAMTFSATSGTKVLTQNGVSTPSGTVFNGTGGTFQLADALTLTGTAALTRTAGTFDANGKLVTLAGTAHTITGTFTGASTFASLTRTGTAVASDSLTLAGDIAATGTLTLTGNSVTNRLLIQSSTLGTPRTITAAAVALTNCDFMDITGAGAATWIGLTGSELIGTAANRDFSSDTGNWFKPSGSIISGGMFSFSSVEPISAAVLNIGGLSKGKAYAVTFTISGYSAGGVGASFGESIGTVRSANGTYTDLVTNFSSPPSGLSFYTNGGANTTLSIDNVSLKEVNNLGDALGNSGIRFSPSVTQYWKTTTTGTKLWSDVANWFLGSGGTGGTGRVPLPQDNVIFNSGSIGAVSTTIRADMPRLGKDIDWTGVMNSPTTAAIMGFAIYGSLTMAAGTGLWGGLTWQMRARSAVIFKSAGNSISGNLQCVSPGATITFQDAMTFTSGKGLSLYAGAIDSAGYSLTASYVVDLGATLTRSITLGATTVTLTGNDTSGGAAAWDVGNTTGATVSAASSTIKLTDATTNTKSFKGAGNTYNNIWLSGAGSGSFNFTGSNTFNEVKVDNTPKDVRFTAGTTTTMTTLTTPAYNPADVKFVRLPNLSTSGFSTPDSTNTSITGSIECEALLRFQNWNAPGGGAIAVYAATFSGSGQYAYEFFIDTAGLLAVATSADGSTFPLVKYATVSAGTVFSTNSWGWVKTTVDTTTGQAEFLTAPDAAGVPGTYTRLGTLPSAIGATSIFNSTSPLTVGMCGDFATTFNGDIGRVKLRNGIGGTVAADFNPNNWITGNTWTSSTTGEVWTRNGSALIHPEIKISSITNAQHTLSSPSAITGHHLNISYSNAI